MKRITNDLLTNFEEYLQNEEKAAATVDKYMRDVKSFADWSTDRDLTKSLVLEYKGHLTQRYAPASVNSVISSLNHFFSYLEWFDLRVKSLKIQKQIFASTEKELTKTEYERLLTAAKGRHNQRLYLLMQTICSTGIRVSELRFITAEAVRDGRAMIHCKGKNRSVFLPRQLCILLRQYLKEQKRNSGPVFISKNGNPLDRSNIWADMKHVCESAGVSAQKVFPHNLRHLFARTYYHIQKDIVRLADILGHTSVNTTRIYTMETGEIHRRQIQKLGLLRC
ncbi:MAG: tyrosine-type recombinase/integrase [Clostridia bacterium]|nr:tyrosine-type recombinase/integrase [Clostridia bacterium]